MTDLGSLPDHLDSEAFAINTDGVIAGSSGIYAYGILRAFKWVNGSMTDLGTLGGASGIAYGINKYGDIVGLSQGTYPLTAVPTLWADGTTTYLGTLGGSFGEAHGINDYRQIAGVNTLGSPDRHAFLWEAGTMYDLGTLGGRNSEASAINGSGFVVGWAANETTSHATLWANRNTITDLGTLGGTYSSAAAISSNGIIVGRSFTINNVAMHAAMWTAK
jgi:probable HAF family extracellular repeat protein